MIMIKTSHQHLRSRLRTASLSIEQPTSAGKVLHLRQNSVIAAFCKIVSNQIFYGHHLIKPPLLSADQQGSFKLLGCMVEAAKAQSV